MESLLRQLGEVHRHPPRLVVRQPIWSPSGATQRYVRNRVSAQPVDATQALNLSAGVSNVKVLRGRSLS